MVAIILAAGYATRLYPLTMDMPKALLEIGGMTMLDRIMEKVNEIDGITKTIVVSNNKFYDHFLRWKEDYNKNSCPEPGLKACAGAGPVILNDMTDSEQNRLGAIGDIKFAIDELGIDDEVIIIAGDNLFDFSLRGLIDFYRDMDADCIIVKKEADAEMLKRFGVVVTSPDNLVVDFEEKPKKPKSDLAAYAIYVYKRETLPLLDIYINEGNSKDAPGSFPAWLYNKKRLAAYHFKGNCYDIGTPEVYRELCERYSNST